MLQRIREASERALAGGQLRPIETYSIWREDYGMPFLIRQVASLREKPHTSPSDWPTTSAEAQPAAAKLANDTLTQSPPNNPFLPYDPAMFVADVSSTHVALLNKFPVVPNHLLVVTREFQLQSTRLARADFDALANCQLQFESLGFYNSGTIAGASQPHRHLQLIPLPLTDRTDQPDPTVFPTDQSDDLNDPTDLPIDVLLLRDAPPSSAACSSHVPFAHRWIGIPAANDAATLGTHFLSAYDRLLESVGWNEVTPQRPYNLLTTRRWMMLVPRRREAFDGISLNSMAYAGALLVRTREELDRLCTAGPMQALIATAGL
ncbi:MAG: hypothetical protein KDB23_13925 [Planctomycetales bacterium]|nr:hypothetical protein [Planctomycetales bacterium]